VVVVEGGEVEVEDKNPSLLNPPLQSMLVIYPMVWYKEI
jgi:hypothetical protein